MLSVLRAVESQLKEDKVDGKLHNSLGLEAERKDNQAHQHKELRGGSKKHQLLVVCMGKGRNTVGKGM